MHVASVKDSNTTHRLDKLQAFARKAIPRSVRKFLPISLSVAIGDKNALGTGQVSPVDFREKEHDGLTDTSTSPPSPLSGGKAKRPKGESNQEDQPRVETDRPLELIGTVNAEGPSLLPQPDDINDQRVLIISNTGGGAHESLARNIVQQLECMPGRVVYHKKDFLSSDLNYFFIKRIADRYYNQASAKGEGRKQAFIMSTRYIGEVIFLPVVYEKLLRLLLKTKPTRVVCTEPLGLIPMVRAIRTYNSMVKRNNGQLAKKGVVSRQRLIPEFELWMTDMPTVHTQHTFQSLRLMLQSDRRMVKLYTPPPLLWKSRAVNDHEFWFRQCAFKVDENHPNSDVCGHVRYLAFTKDDVKRGMPLPISPIFIEQNTTVGSSVNIPIRFSTADEMQIVWQTCPAMLSADHTNNPAREAFARVHSTDVVISCILSSRPSAVAMLGYISMLVTEVEKRNREKQHQDSPTDTTEDRHTSHEKCRIVFFLFCGRHQSNLMDSPFSKISARARQIARALQARQKEGSKWELHFVPLGFQNPNTVAAVTARSDVNIRQSGGLSCMEILAMAKKADKMKKRQHWLIHVEVIAQCERISAEKLRTRIVEKFAKRRERRGSLPIGPVDTEHEAVFRWLLSHSSRKWEAGNAQYLRQTVGAKVTNPCISPSRILLPL